MAHLDSKELMIGDLVINTEFDKNEIETIETIEPNRVWLTHSKTYVPIEYIKPVIITTEILEKNGWEKRPTGYVFYTDGKRYDNSLWYIFGSNTFVVNTAEFQIKYVHELQHALRLCGIKKQIDYEQATKE